MEIDEFLKYRKDLLNESRDEDGFISESAFLEAIIPQMADAKLIDSEDFNESYYIFKTERFKINAYSINESGERLQIYIVNEDALKDDAEDSALQITLKADYDTHFARAVKFITACINGNITDELQDGDGIKVLTTHMASPEGLDQCDVVEVFLVTATATIENRGAAPQPKQMEFANEKIKVVFKKKHEKITKEIRVIKKLVDLNFLHSVLISQGNREPLTVDFEKLFDFRIEAIKAADEEYFESYLCVLPGPVISDLYKEFSTRMLEKNVRSFLQFPKKGVNSGMKDTIIDYPEKFIAYNNGLTITSTGKDVEEIKGKFFIKSLTDFQIVNGGQTTATIYFTQKEGIPVDKVRVMAKINVAKNSTPEELDKLITEISTYSNAQSRVSKVDLRARSTQLVKIKALSESVVTPRGLKWFFERAKGELNTTIRKLGNKDKIIKKFPKERRFTKEDLAKYYTVWGNKPFLVKLGGEKVFREFIEEISGQGIKRKEPLINRAFYENLISRIILFRSLEKIYGDGKNKIGNLRAAVIPYSVSVLYNRTDGGDDDLIFDFSKIWAKESLELDFADYMHSLMKLMNTLIKTCSTSDDPSENSKTRELWERIYESDELQRFLEKRDTEKILRLYTITKDEYKKRMLKSAKTAEVDFKYVQDNVSIHANGLAFYKKIAESFAGFTQKEKEDLEKIIMSVHKKSDLEQQYIDAEGELINKVLAKAPEIFDQVTTDPDNALVKTLDYIIDSYNNAVNSHEEVKSVFDSIQQNAQTKSIKNHTVWGKIGERLTKGEAPAMADLVAASSLLLSTKEDGKMKETIKIEGPILTAMIEWDSKKKVLSTNERQYLTDFAYGFKKLNAFHEGIIKKHLLTIMRAGFDPNEKILKER